MADTSALEQKAVEIITNLEKLAEPAMQLTLRAIKLSAILDLILSAALITLLVLFWWKVVPRIYAALSKAIDDDWGHPCIVIPGIIAAVGSLVLAIGAALSLFSTSNWIAIFAPELALAKLLLGKIT